MKIENRVIALVEEKIAEKPDLFLVEVKMKGNKLTIHVDGDQGISIQDCAAISRHVGFHLEEENLIDDAYNLEVSSPGIDAPLKMLRQYQKNVGRNVTLKLADGSTKEGKLLNIQEKSILIEEKVKEKGKKAFTIETDLPIDQIIETKVLISFK